MAFVPDLDTLESSSLNEETFYGPNGLCPQKKSRLDLEATSPGVDIQVMVTKAQPAKTFRQAAVLVVAVTKLLKQPMHKDFADSDLGAFLDDIFGMGEWCQGYHPSRGMLLRDAPGLESTGIFLTIPLSTEPVSFQQIKSSHAGAPVYRYTRSQSFDIFDIDQKCFVLESPTQLVALHLQGPSAGRKVKLNIALYRPRLSQGGPGTWQMPVALGIKGYQLYLSCVMSGAEPMLQLEEADIKRDIESVELTRFIFYRVDSLPEKTTRFESAAFPGWFICTSLQPHQPVGITNQPDQVNIATYKLIRH
ncbi:interleukin-1 beta-like isoform X1 [Falco naumanni]|uniref:interleukin-1 beta-like isoform X1 n=1 Tax=Falco naumanni TaxID=148594 RepID=UPI001ADE3E7A|nr:interleukin-1 beta-like isoform X1 [Falco naumanni]XP_040474247.1 interleukin-1 beta-like isoform X1 [Falco naumanni]XP_040474249.1 interleukin-1 beta-like isoform X1 [Falco naumanni]